MIADMFYSASPSIEEAQLRKERMKFFTNGNGKVTAYIDGGISSSSYQTTFKGMQNRLRNVFVDNRQVMSNVSSQLVPDPRVLHLATNQ